MWGFIARVLEKPEHYWDTQNGREAVYEFGGQRYHARQCWEHILYRTEDRLDTDSTLAVPCRFEYARNLDEPTPFVYPEAVFQEQVENGDSRRFAFFDTAVARGAPILLFAPDGTGTFYDYDATSTAPYDCPSQGIKQPDGTWTPPRGFGYNPHQRGYNYRGYENGDSIPFSWDGSAHELRDRRDILTCPWETVKALGEDMFASQLWRRMEDPYVGYAETPDIPLQFDCGSRAELELVTQCICRLDENAFPDSRGEYYVSYYSTTPYEVKKHWNDPPGLSKCWLSDRSKELCAQAFRRNSFHGGHWVKSGFASNPRRFQYKMQPMSIGIRTLPPSAQERAQAQRLLDDWLASG